MVTLDAADCPEVTDLATITGSVTDEGPVYYGLYFKEQGGSDWRALANGQSQDDEINSELGQLDPTNLRNGVYDLMLLGLDIAGNSSISQGCIFVDGGMKIGVVNLPAWDMSVPAPGFPLGLEREYNSRDAGPGDFGQGWNRPSSNVKAMTTKSLSGG